MGSISGAEMWRKKTAATQPAAVVMFCLDPWELGLMSNEKKDLLV